LYILVAAFKKILKTVHEDLQKNSIQLGRHVFLNVFNILKPTSLRTEKKSAGGGILLMRIRCAAYLHNTVFGQKCLHYQRGMGRGGIVVQQKPTALCSKLWPHPGNALQQSFGNLNVKALMSAHQAQIFMHHTLFVKKCNEHGFDLGTLQTKLLGLGNDSEVHCML
jgi:hypothetical protein